MLILSATLIDILKLFCFLLSVPFGGALFEAYVLIFGSWKSHNQLKALKAQSDDSEDDGAFDLAAAQEILQREKLHFLGFVLFVTSRIRTGCRDQMFYYTYNATYHGMSRQGVRVQSKLGFMMPLSSFDKIRATKRILAEENVR